MTTSPLLDRARHRFWTERSRAAARDYRKVLIHAVREGWLPESEARGISRLIDHFKKGNLYPEL